MNKKQNNDFCNYIECIHYGGELMLILDLLNRINMTLSDSVIEHLDFLAQALTNYGMEHLDFSDHYKKYHLGKKGFKFDDEKQN